MARLQEAGPSPAARGGIAKSQVCLKEQAWLLNNHLKKRCKRTMLEMKSRCLPSSSAYPAASAFLRGRNPKPSRAKTRNADPKNRKIVWTDA